MPGSGSAWPPMPEMDAAAEWAPPQRRLKRAPPQVRLIDALSDAGLRAIEATSFVSPKWVPQLADAADVLARMRRAPGVAYPVLTPNLKVWSVALGRVWVCGSMQRGKLV
eukprot:258548-Chlamydomonas_euryale.AAC.2